MDMHTAGSGNLLSSSTLSGDKVVDSIGQKLGSIEDLMIDVDQGNIAYAVLSVGGLFGMGDRLFAIPWSALRVDTKNKQLVLNVNKDQLEKAPGFDKDNWPDFADRAWAQSVHTHYGTKLS